MKIFLKQFASTDGVLHSLLKNELHIFHCLQISPKDFENPLVWSVAHENQNFHVVLFSSSIFWDCWVFDYDKENFQYC